MKYRHGGFLANWVDASSSKHDFILLCSQLAVME